MRNQWLAFATSVLLAACFVDSTGIGTYTSPPTGSSSGGENPVVGDAFPPGAVSYFRKAACPDDWDFFPLAHGRAIIAANDGLPRGTLFGEPLEKGEDREHEHSMTTVIEVPETQIAAIEGGGNDGMTPAGMNTFSAISGRVASGVPYMRLLTCKKREAPDTNALPLPSKLHAYFDLDACPSGWKKVAMTEGRLVVGRPADAPADLPFGGKSITSPEMPVHTHSFESTFDTNGHGVALASGCCGKFGKKGSIVVAGESDSAVVDIPMIALLQCEKE